MLNLTRRLARTLHSLQDPHANRLDTSLFRLDRCLVELRDTYTSATPLLWIDDVAASLHLAHRHLTTVITHSHTPKSTLPHSTSSPITTSSVSPPDPANDPSDPLHTSQNQTHLTHHSHRPRLSHPPSRKSRRHSASVPSFARQRRRSLASLFVSPSSAALNNHTSNRSPRLSHSNTRSIPPSVLNNPFSERFRSSFARLISPSSPSSSPPVRPNTHSPSSTITVDAAHAFMSASRTVDEWVAAVRATKDHRTVDDGDSCISLSDALPPLPQQYTPCRDHIYQSARDALLSAAVRVAVPSSSSSSTHAATVSAATTAHALHTTQTSVPPTVIALVGPHGVGKTMLATELVHDVDICQNFADGVAWIQLGSDITDEELAENVITCVDTIIAGDFRSTVRYCNSLEAIVARASRLLRNVSGLIVIDDVCGDSARRAFKIVTAMFGAACVALYTAPVEAHVYDTDNSNNGSDNTSKPVTCLATIDVRRLDPDGSEAASVFRNWLTKTASDESRDGSLKHVTDQNMIVSRCYGLPLALAMAGGFLSKFLNSWTALAASLASSPSCDETIMRIMRLLHTKGGLRFEQQLKAIGSLPTGTWVSLSALADIWSTDYRTIKLSARRLGRMAFGEYRLSDTSDESRVRFHWHVAKYCAQITKAEDEREANRRLLTNLSRRRSSSTKSREKIEYLPWWSGVVTDKYLCRRLHWHMARSESFYTLQDLICDYQWVCHRLENDSLVGVLTEMRMAMSSEHRNGRRHEMIGYAGMMKALEDVAKLRREEAIEMNALPTFLVSQLQYLEDSSECVREFLTSIYEKARRPWLKPMAEVETPIAASQVESTSSGSMESESMPYVVNCLTSSGSGKVVCGDGGGNVYVYDPASGKNVVSWSGSSVGGEERWRGVGALGTIQDYVVSGHYNGRVLLRSIRSGRSELLEDGEEDGDKVTCIGSSDLGMVVVGCYSGKLYVLRSVHDFDCGVKRIDLEGHCHMVTSLYIFPDGERIASSSYGGFAAIWRVKKDRQHERISLNGHKPDIGHKENYITTFASVGGGKRLLSSCRGGVVSAWNSSTGECLWTKRYGFEFSRSASLQAFGVRQFAGTLKGEFDGSFKGVNGLKVGYPYMITRGEGPRELLIVASGDGREILATVPTEQVISTWLEVWHPGSRRIFVAVSHADGRLCCYELVSSLR